MEESIGDIKATIRNDNAMEYEATEARLNSYPKKEMVSGAMAE